MRIRSFLDVQILIYPASKVQPNHRVYRPCMITLREGTIFDAFAPGNVAWVAMQDENLEARKIYTQKPYNDTLSPSRNFASLGMTVMMSQSKTFKCSIEMLLKIVSAGSQIFHGDYTQHTHGEVVQLNSVTSTYPVITIQSPVCVCSPRAYI